MQKKNNKETMKRVLKYIRKYTPALVLSLLLAGLTVLLTLYIPILTGNAVDLIIGEGQVDMPDIFAIMKKIAIVMIITAVGQWVMNTCNNYITYHVIRDIRTDAFAKLEILPLKYLDAHAYGDIVSRVIADVDTADGIYPTVHRCTDDPVYAGLHVGDQCAHHTGSSMYHSGILPGGKIHCNQDLLHVQGAVRDQRRADLPD